MSNNFDSSSHMGDMGPITGHRDQKYAKMMRNSTQNHLSNLGAVTGKGGLSAGGESSTASSSQLPPLDSDRIPRVNGRR